MPRGVPPHQHSINDIIGAVSSSGDGDGGGGVSAGDLALERAQRQSADADLQAQIDAEEAARIAADADLEARKVNIGTDFAADRVLVGENATTAKGDANLTWTPGAVSATDYTVVGLNAPELSIGTLAAGRYVLRYTSGAVLWNDSPTTYAATRAAIIQSVGLQVWHDGAWNWFSGTVDEAADAASAEALAAGKLYNLTLASPQEVKLRFYDGGASNNSGSVVVTVSSEGTLNVEGTVDANTLRGDDMAGTGERVTVAQADGTLRDVDEVTWSGTKLAISTRTVGVRYRHVQGSPSATWVIVHNLDEYPSVTVVDSSGNVCLGDVRYDSTNQITVSFGAAFAGNAYLN